MALDTRISWSDNTLNFWVGCHATTNRSCQFCYATQRVLPAMGESPHQVRRTAEATWHQATKWQTRHQATGTIETVFTCSLSDFFHPHADEWREDAWKVIRDTPNLQWIILTQRIEGVPSRLPGDWGTGYPNVWLGISASDQAHADKRIPKLLAIPAALHLVSLEPLLERVALKPEWLPVGKVVNLKHEPYDVRIDRATKWGNPFHIGIDGDRAAVIQKHAAWIQGQPELMAALPELVGKRLGCHCAPEPCHGDTLLQLAEGNRLKWVITGGLSGDAWEQHRLYPSWVRGLRDQCTGAGIPFHFKQLGGPATNYRDGDQALLDGATWKQVPLATAIPVQRTKGSTEQQLTLL